MKNPNGLSIEEIEEWQYELEERERKRRPEESAMTEQEQRIALCEWMGYHLEEESNGCKVWYGPNDVAQRGLPDTNSLDVLHEMEMKMDKRQQDVFAGILGEIVCGRQIDFGAMRINTTTEILFATAAQRRKALCRTLGLWKD